MELWEEEVNQTRSLMSAISDELEVADEERTRFLEAKLGYSNAVLTVKEKALADLKKKLDSRDTVSSWQ